MRERPDFTQLPAVLFKNKTVQHTSNMENEGFTVYEFTTQELEELAAVLADMTTCPIVICLYGPVQDAETGKNYVLNGHVAVHGGSGYSANVWTLPYNDVRVTVHDNMLFFEKARIFAELIPGAVDKWQKTHAGANHPLFA
jgi:hypothetical protein